PDPLDRSDSSTPHEADHDPPVKKRLVVVTGGLSGIGAACVQHFRRAGDRADVETPVDVADAASVEEFFAALPAAPDVLVNAAGINDGGALLRLSFAE